MVENLEKVETCKSSKRGVVRSNLRNCNKSKRTTNEERKESKRRKEKNTEPLDVLFSLHDRLGKQKARAGL